MLHEALLLDNLCPTCNANLLRKLNYNFFDKSTLNLRNYLLGKEILLFKIN